nr:MAG TPA: hypothetical protein [Caudoviricetes sp.]
MTPLLEIFKIFIKEISFFLWCLRLCLRSLSRLFLSYFPFCCCSVVVLVLNDEV